jgi:hypothetical protein
MSGSPGGFPGVPGGSPGGFPGVPGGLPGASGGPEGPPPGPPPGLPLPAGLPVPPVPPPDGPPGTARPGPFLELEGPPGVPPTPGGTGPAPVVAFGDGPEAICVDAGGAAIVGGVLSSGMSSRRNAGVSRTAAGGSRGETGPGSSASWFAHRARAMFLPSVSTRSPAGITTGLRVQNTSSPSR